MHQGVKPSAILIRAGRRHVHAKCPRPRALSRRLGYTSEGHDDRSTKFDPPPAAVDETTPSTPSSRLAHDYTMKLHKN